MLFHLSAILRIIHFVCPLKVLLKYGLQNNYWFGHSVMKPVDAVEFQKRKSAREVNNEEIENFEIESIDECALDKALEVLGNVLGETPPGGKFMRLLTMTTSKNQMFSF